MTRKIAFRVLVLCALCSNLKAASAQSTEPSANASPAANANASPVASNTNSDAPFAYAPFADAPTVIATEIPSVATPDEIKTSSGIVARPIPTQTTQLPENGRSMFDLSAPIAPSEPKTAAKADDKTDAKSGDKASSAAVAMTPSENAYEAIWRNMLGYKGSDNWRTDSKSASQVLTTDDVWIKANALQASQNARLIEQNDALLKQNAQILELLQQIADAKTPNSKNVNATSAAK